MIQVGWWLHLESLALRGIALGFNDLALKHGWVLKMGLHPDSPLAAECDAHVVGPGMPPGALSRLRKSGPLVATEWDWTSHGIASVVSDHAAIGKLAADHLLQRGIRNFAGIGFGQQPFWLERRAAFRRTVELAGGVYWDDPGGGVVNSPRDAARWLATLPRPVGVFVGADAWGSMLLPFLTHNGVRVPLETAVIGVDNDEFMCELTQPALTSVVIPWRQLGRQAAQLLHAMLEGKRVDVRRYIIAPAGIAARGSSDMLAIPDEHVVAALVYIQRQFERNISVSDVLREVPVHRKKLEAGFRTHVGHGIMREIRRLRVERARQLLIMTNMTLDQVARRAGFVSVQKMTELFGRIAGIPPGRYRQRFRLGRGPFAS